MSNILECRQVTKHFTDGKSQLKVLTGVDFTLGKGEQVAIVGRSGSGKTTLLQMLGGLDAPSSGQVLMKGQDLQQITDDERGKLRNQSLGFIYQFHHLLPEFTALENVAMPLFIGGQEPKACLQAASTLLGAVGLKERASHRPSKLSGGERQRVAIARALATNPDCVLADEPTGNLDKDNADHTFEIMKQLNHEKQTSFVVVTHDLELASRMDKIYYLEQGALVQK